MMLTIFFLMILLTVMFYIINLLMTEKSKVFSKDHSSFECGFEGIHWIYNKISVHFFKIGIVFIIFDLEMIYLLIIINNSNFVIQIMLILNFIMLTLYMEIYFNSLSWNYYEMNS